jgi:hypothetical protein
MLSGYDKNNIELDSKYNNYCRDLIVISHQIQPILRYSNFSIQIFNFVFFFFFFFTPTQLKFTLEKILNRIHAGALDR